MPAKYLQMLGEDRRPELHRQAGCVTGILQAFDRRYPLAAHRSHKRLLPPGHALSSSPSVREERIRCSPQIVLDKNLSKSWIDNQREPFTVELSQGSYSSSSSCSSFSSHDGNRPTQQDLSSTDQMLFPEKPFKCTPKLKSSPDSDNGLDYYPDDALTKPSAQSSYPILGIRNLVKDSIYRDTRDLSTRTYTKEAEKDHIFNCGDPPRSLDEPPSSVVQGKNKGTMDIDESLRVLAKLREASWNPTETGQQPRLPYDPPRFSYDGRESASSKLREVPRLSLDIKESPLRNHEIDSRPKPNMIAADRRSSINKELNAALETQQEQPACKRLPSVVAKLMGLEDLPEPKDNTVVSLSRSVTESKEEPMLSPLSIFSHNEPTPRQQRNLDSTIRNVPKFPVETAPWKQKEKIVLPRKLPKGLKVAHGKEQPATSVYSEIEKRLKDLDFQQSNKDLRALKQILDSMQAKGLLQNKKHEEPSMLKVYDGNHNSREVTDAIRLDSTSNTKQVPEGAPSFSMQEESTTERYFKSPIVIMKPAKSADLMSEVADDSSVDPLGGLSELSAGQDGSVSVVSELNVEVTSADRSAEASILSFQQGTQTPSGKNPQKVKTSYDANKNLPSMDPAATIPERPSPVSVLDSSFDQDDFFHTSKVSNSSIVDDEHHPSSSESSKPFDMKSTKLTTQPKNSKLANIASLLQKLQQLSVSKDDVEAPPVDHIAFLCETQSPDHRYISEILLASGLLMKDLGSGQTGLSEMQLHTSGYLINPDLFLVLEQRKSGWISKTEGIHQGRSTTRPDDPKRARRKLMFDAMNELLLQKFEKETTLHSASSLTGARDPLSSGQQLVKTICSGIECLETERSRMCQEDSSVIPDAEILQRLEGWSPSFSRRELPAMVLEIERSIFKELVDEVVHGHSESADGQPAKAGRRRRRLFA
ncbi:hypothetical protein GUJ93_ZPchr0007g3167 [Zizania palustris]|uniref:DUF4378 domain-containing protein n=1 Tax=Zizania palustris TaxID=103762 RepID=A0A8J5W5G5_ZIZPA|nr:hypothetical protein GUJ93_ZPchr0007g3167 [Zizania palustris]